MSLPWLREPWRRIIEDLNTQRLSHAHCIPWRPELGTDKFVQAFVRLLLCLEPTQQACGQCKSCLLMQADTHPDYHFIESVDGKAIGVDAIRALTQELQQTASQHGAKVAWIADADRMTTAAANALLKTLEEPTAKTYLVLSPRRTNQLLPTIRSRMHLHNFAAPPLAALQAWLSGRVQRELTPQELQVAQRYASAPLTALAAIQEPDAQATDKLSQLAQAWITGAAWPKLAKQDWQEWLQTSELLLQELVRICQKVPQSRLLYPEMYSTLDAWLTQKQISVTQLTEWLRLCYTLREQTREQTGLNGPLLLQQQWLQWKQTP